MPERRVAHSRAVAAVAAALAAALNARGQHLCEPLVLAGGLLHDIARAQPRHPDAGADLLEGLGYPRAAGVVRLHMELAGGAGADASRGACPVARTVAVRRSSGHGVSRGGGGMAR